MNHGKAIHLYFSDIFEVSPKVLDKYGAYQIYGLTPEEIAIVEGKG